MGPYAEIDESAAPLIRISVVGEPDAENYPAYLNEMGEAFRRHAFFGMVFNTGALGNLPARYRELQSAWLKETEAEFSERWICAAFVIQSRVIRGVLMTLFWVNRPYYQHFVTASAEEAEEWVKRRLAEHEGSQKVSHG